MHEFVRIAKKGHLLKYAKMCKITHIHMYRPMNIAKSIALLMLTKNICSL